MEIVVPYRIKDLSDSYDDKMFATVDSYKKNAVKSARELGYGSDVVERIHAATTSREITRIMKTARIGGDI